MSQFPLRLLANARDLPSGDHAGFQSSPGLSVSCLISVPSGRITKSSTSPVRSLLNAMNPPSGDHAGCSSET